MIYHHGKVDLTAGRVYDRYYYDTEQEASRHLELMRSEGRRTTGYFMAHYYTPEGLHLSWGADFSWEDI